VQWGDYQQTDKEADGIKVRRCFKDALLFDQPYQLTRQGALNSQTEIVDSNTSRSSAASQSKDNIRNKVWPTDIFGNKGVDEEIAHLLPAAKQQHKEWIYVAAAVVGIGLNAKPDELKKAVRGYKKERNRCAGTGVVHFVSNKLRMFAQRNVLDVDSPCALLIPVMNLTQAKTWEGEAYSALFVMGWPEKLDSSQQDRFLKSYRTVDLSTPIVMSGNVIEDATSEDIKVALKNLIDAVLVLRDIFAQMTPEKFQALNLNPLELHGVAQARNHAQESVWILPKLIIKNQDDRRPLCLVKFGELQEPDTHSTRSVALGLQSSSGMVENDENEKIVSQW
jgi:hypothetical protein